MSKPRDKHVNGKKGPAVTRPSLTRTIPEHYKVKLPENGTTRHRFLSLLYTLYQDAGRQPCECSKDSESQPHVQHGEES